MSKIEENVELSLSKSSEIPSDFPMVAWYDGKCPICSGFSRVLRKKVPKEKLVLKDLHSSKEMAKNKDHFRVEWRGQIFQDQEAIDIMSEHIPEIKEFFWMLPYKLRGGAVDIIWKASSWMRKKLHEKWKKDADCDCDHEINSFDLKNQIKKNNFL